MVSVIIPNYNHAAYLTERIESILCQSYQKFELIILDDCSNDSSREIIEAYRANKHVSHIVYNNKNSGSAFIQWNRGFELATGEYIWIAESDDLAHPNFLENCVKELERNSNTSLVYSKSQKIDAYGKEFKHKLFHSLRQLGTNRYSGMSFIRKKMLRRNDVCNASMAVFRKDAIPKDVNYMQYRYCGDWLFWAEVASKGYVARINYRYNYMRQHENRVTTRAVREGLHYQEGETVIPKLLELAHASHALQLATWGKHLWSLKRERKLQRIEPSIHAKIEETWYAKFTDHRFLRIWSKIYVIFN